MAGCLGMVIAFPREYKNGSRFWLKRNPYHVDEYRADQFLSARKKGKNDLGGAWLTGLFLIIEVSFLTANLQKIKEGGWITLIIGAILFSIMYVWRKGRNIVNGFKKLVSIEEYIPKLKRLSSTENITKYATNLVYLTSSGTPRQSGENSHRFHFVEIAQNGPISIGSYT